MTLLQRIHAFHTLGSQLSHLSPDDFQTIAERTRQENPWFTEPNVRMALDGVQQFLRTDALTAWTAPYTFGPDPKRVALVMAGNIPLVGFHDFLSVLIAGHVAVIKLSSKDTVLLRWLIGLLVEIEPAFKNQIEIVERLQLFDAVIATGSDNSSRYFEYYFGKYPHIIRKNRTSVAILTGKETQDQIIALGDDVFSYFGLGCRNVSKVYVPEGYNFGTLLSPWEPRNPIIHHHKYCNNYDYQKSILLVNCVPFLDNGFVLLRESDKMVSPISVLFYETYSDDQSLAANLASHADKLQCIAGEHALASVPPGQTQYPTLTDYPDQVDVLKFLEGLR